MVHWASKGGHAMCDNEYLAHAMVKERLREAVARGAFNAMLQQSRGADTGRARTRPTRLALWWHEPAAWVAHLALPKIWNRL